MHTPLTNQEREWFNAMLDGIQDGSSVCLVRSVLDGQPVTVVAGVNSEDDGSIMMYPLAILVDDWLLGRLENPAEH